MKSKIFSRQKGQGRTKEQEGWLAWWILISAQHIIYKELARTVEESNA